MVRNRWALPIAIVCTLSCADPVVTPGSGTGDGEDDPGGTGAPPNDGGDAASATSTSGAPPAGTSNGEGGIGDGTIGDDADDDQDGGSVFLPYPDFEPPPFECDLFAQDCPPGHKCMPWANDGGPAWNATRCSPIAADPAQVGEVCTVEGTGVSGIDDCDIGLMCWDVDERGVGICEDMCTGNADTPVCENPADVCSIANDGAIVLCLPTCDPVAPACPGTQTCYPMNRHWICAPGSPDGGEGTHGDACEYAGDCAPGHSCASTSAFTTCDDITHCCTAFCDLNDDGSDAMCAASDPAQSCAPYYAEGTAPEGYEHVGICTIPP